ncbi:hypothetical protein BJY01DRAFT_207624 [Aspergillus pseudoustus]|uniref:Uncharacterized protein n=1 Tax=Aspergillus pseudoustus TaxID=1810923 RepID=A0ABR4KKK1_9EURO
MQNPRACRLQARMNFTSVLALALARSSNSRTRMGIPGNGGSKEEAEKGGQKSGSWSLPSNLFDDASTDLDLSRPEIAAFLGTPYLRPSSGEQE